LPVASVLSSALPIPSQVVPKVVRVEEELPNALSPVHLLESRRSDEEAAVMVMFPDPLKGVPLMVREVASTVAAVVVPRIWLVKALLPEKVLESMRSEEDAAETVTEEPSVTGVPLTVTDAF